MGKVIQGFDREEEIFTLSRAGWGQARRQAGPRRARRQAGARRGGMGVVGPAGLGWVGLWCWEGWAGPGGAKARATDASTCIAEQVKVGTACGSGCCGKPNSFLHGFLRQQPRKIRSLLLLRLGLQLHVDVKLVWKTRI